MVNEAEQKIIDSVDRNGWCTVTYVPATESDPEEWFSYTVGLTKAAGWPEIICFGLDEERAAGMLRLANAGNGAFGPPAAWN